MKKLICGYLKNFKCIETRCKKNISSFYVDLDVAGVVRIYREAVVLGCLISHVWLRHLLNCLHCWFPTPSTSPQSRKPAILNLGCLTSDREIIYVGA